MTGLLWQNRAIPWSIPDGRLVQFMLRACRDLQELAHLLDMDEPIARFEAGSTVSQRGVIGFGTTTLVAITISATPLPTPR